MATKAKPKLDAEIGGFRVRVYSRRDCFEAIIGEGDVSDPEADVWVFPKVGTPNVWARQAVANHVARSKR